MIDEWIDSIDPSKVDVSALRRIIWIDEAEIKEVDWVYQPKKLLHEVEMLKRLLVKVEKNQEGR